MFGRSTTIPGWRSRLTVSLGNGDGTYRTGTSVLLASLSGYSNRSYSYISSGDFNEDGKLDILCSVSLLTSFNGIGSVQTSVRLYAGRGDGTLQTAVSVASVSGIVTANVADFNGDGNLDFSVGAGVNLYLGNGDGTFRNVNPATGTSAVGDFNRDGLADVATLDAAAGTVLVSLGNSNGTYQPAQTLRPRKPHRAGGDRPRWRRLARPGVTNRGTPDGVATTASGNTVSASIPVPHGRASRREIPPLPSPNLGEGAPTRTLTG
jgi:hypothetical protein